MGSFRIGQQPRMSLGRVASTPAKRIRRLMCFGEIKIDTTIIVQVETGGRKRPSPVGLLENFEKVQIGRRLLQFAKLSSLIQRKRHLNPALFQTRLICLRFAAIMYTPVLYIRCVRIRIQRWTDNFTHSDRFNIIENITITTNRFNRLYLVFLRLPIYLV